jgi:hypothetical protein
MDKVFLAFLRYPGGLASPGLWRRKEKNKATEEMFISKWSLV